MLRRIDGIASSWWFGDGLILVLCACVALVAFAMTPSRELVSLGGVDIPLMCTFRRLTGYGCPGCGLTRSFAFMAEGSVGEAFRMNLLGPLLFTAVVAQVPYRVLRLRRRALSRPGEFG